MPALSDEAKAKRRAARAAYRAANPEKVAAEKKAWRAKNKERIAATNRAWHVANPDKVKEHKRRYRETHPDQVRAYMRAYQAANKERIHERMAEYRRQFPELVAAQRRATEERRDKEQVRQRNLDYRERFPDLVKAQWRIKKARRRGQLEAIDLDAQAAIRAKAPERLSQSRWLVRELEQQFLKARGDRRAQALVDLLREEQVAVAAARCMSDDERSAVDAWLKQNSLMAAAARRSRAKPKPADPAAVSVVVKAAGKKRRPSAAESRKAALSDSFIFTVADKAVPRDLPKYKRDDLIAEIVLGIMEGNIAEADVAKAAKAIVAEYNRKFGDFQQRSLDDVISGTTIRKIDMLVAPED